ncbi:hypothetical protein BCON_0003g00270 [Botryotinia convoluta]|uniref:Uncharacterized protein n=1 Tax=Botryotinia convoluta TaxID=54673 RepID=A0A4Z1J7X4_9HELO|nr:hypothetical protein BCON_0003g00270 [Botryotinia convoluta]
MPSLVTIAAVAPIPLCCIYTTPRSHPYNYWTNLELIDIVSRASSFIADAVGGSKRVLSMQG